MNDLDRRSFLKSLAVFSATPWLVACKAQPTRESVLRELGRELCVQHTSSIASTSAALAKQCAAWSADPNAAALSAARTAFRAALLAWEQVYGFRHGPLVESNAFLRATFWPPRPAAIAELLDETTPIDQRFVDGLGVDVKGMFALEHLLFEHRVSTVDGAGSDEQLPRARQLASAYAQDVHARAQAASQTLGDGSAFADDFARAGQDSINKLVNQMLSAMEAVAIERLERLSGLAEQARLVRREVIAAPSGLSREVPLTWVKVTRDIYTGLKSPGLGELVRQVAPEIDHGLRAAFDRALTSLQALEKDLEVAATTQRVPLAQAAQQLRALEVMLKTDLVSALGVTLTFVSGDGD